MRPIDADAVLKNLGMKTEDCNKCKMSCSTEFTRQDFCEAVHDAPTIGGWISVKDRLPEERINPLTQDFAEVICFCDFGGEPRRTDVRTYKFGKPTWEKDGHFLHGGQIMDGVITHWQYLPEPPKEDDA